MRRTLGVVPAGLLTLGATACSERGGSIDPTAPASSPGVAGALSEGTITWSLGSIPPPYQWQWTLTMTGTKGTFVTSVHGANPPLYEVKDVELDPAAQAEVCAAATAVPAETAARVGGETMSWKLTDGQGAVQGSATEPQAFRALHAAAVRAIGEENERKADEAHQKHAKKGR